MKNSPLFLLLFFFTAISVADDKPSTTPSLLDLKSQVSEPLRKQEKEKRIRDTKVPPLSQPVAPPCDPSHGDCLRKHPEYADQLRIPHVPPLAPPVTGGDTRN